VEEYIDTAQPVGSAHVAAASGVRFSRFSLVNASPGEFGEKRPGRRHPLVAARLAGKDGHNAGRRTGHEMDAQKTRRDMHLTLSG